MTDVAMRTANSKDLDLAFVKDLKQVIRPDDEVVVIYSGVWTLSRYFGMVGDALAERVLDLIEEFVGPERTLVLPTFTFSFPKTREYDLVRSSPDTGAMPRRFLIRPGVQRTPKPINSYAVIGPLAAEVMALPVETAWGNGSVMAWMETVNARQCVVGVPWKYCGYFHRAEELLRVPYRYFKRFTGTMYCNGEEPTPCEEVMYVRSLHVIPDQDSRPVANLMRERGHILSARGGSELIESALTNDILGDQLDLLSTDIHTYNTNREEVIRWIKDGKTEEIAELQPDQIPDPPYRPEELP